MKNKKWHKNKIDISTNFKWFVLKKRKEVYYELHF